MSLILIRWLDVSGRVICVWYSLVIQDKIVLQEKLRKIEREVVCMVHCIEILTGERRIKGNG